MATSRDWARESAEKYADAAARLRKALELERDTVRAELEGRTHEQLADLEERMRQSAEQFHVADEQMRLEIHDSISSDMREIEAYCEGGGDSAARYVCLDGACLPGVSDERLPVIVPLFGSGNVLVDASQEDGDRMAREVTFHAMETTKAGGFKLTVFDPLGRRIMAPFNDLPGRAVIGDAKELRDAFDSLQKEIRDTGNAMGDPNANIIDYRRSSWGNEDLGMLHLVVILDFPMRFNKDLLADLSVLMNSGPSAGVSFVIATTEDARAAFAENSSGATEISLDELKANAQVFKSLPGRNGTRFVWEAHPAFDIVLEEHDDAHTRNRVREKADDILSSRESRVVMLGLAPDEEWTHRSSKGLLAVQIARGGRIEFELSFDDKHPHALLSGTSGSGKTEFIKTMVYNMAQHYSPSEFMLVMLDFKNGLGASDFGGKGADPTYLPHARILGENSDMAYALDVLSFVVDQFQKRADMFERFSANNITEFCKASGRSLPRILVIIDEFQMLFEDSSDTGKRASGLLKTIAAQGRSFGIHMLLSTQALSNVRGSGSSSATIVDDLKKNAVIRFALRNDAKESEAILSQGNHTAATLDSYYVDVNDNMGQSGSDHIAKSQMVVLSLAQEKKGAWDARFEDMFEQHGMTAAKPMVFDGAANYRIGDDVNLLARYFENPVYEGPYEVPVGKTVDVRGLPSTVKLNSNIFVFGTSEDTKMDIESDGIFDLGFGDFNFGASEASDDEAPSNRAIGMLQMIGLAYAAQVPSQEDLPAGGRIIVLDGLTSDERKRNNMDAWAAFIEEHTNCSVEMMSAGSDTADIVGLLKSLKEGVSGRRTGKENVSSENILLMGFDMSRFSYFQASGAGACLETLLVGGPVYGIHSVLWFPSGPSVSGIFGRKPLSDVPLDASLILEISSKNLPQTMAPDSVRTPWNGETNRCLHFDPVTKESHRTIPYVPLDTDDLDKLSML